MRIPEVTCLGKPRLPSHAHVMAIGMSHVGAAICCESHQQRVRAAGMAAFKALMNRETVLTQRLAFVFVFKAVQSALVAIIVATMFLRTHIHPNNQRDASFLSGFTFFSLLQTFFVRPRSAAVGTCTGLMHLYTLLGHPDSLCESSCIIGTSICADLHLVSEACTQNLRSRGPVCAQSRSVAAATKPDTVIQAD